MPIGANLDVGRKIQKSKPAIVFAIVFGSIGVLTSLTFTILIWRLTIFPWETRRISSPLESNWGIWSALILLEFIIAFTICSCLIGMFIRFARSPRPGMVLDADGFEYWKFVMKVERISWHDIELIEKKQNKVISMLFGWILPEIFSFVTIYLREDSLSRPKKRFFLHPKDMGDVVIDSRYLVANGYEILEVMTHYWKKSTESASEFSNYPRP
jgi:hypothetical protein